MSRSLDEVLVELDHYIERLELGDPAIILVVKEISAALVKISEWQQRYELEDYKHGPHTTAKTTPPATSTGDLSAAALALITQEIPQSWLLGQIARGAVEGNFKYAGAWAALTRVSPTPVAAAAAISLTLAKLDSKQSAESLNVESVPSRFRRCGEMGIHPKHKWESFGNRTKIYECPGRTRERRS